jgi:hypothetical protein
VIAAEDRKVWTFPTGDHLSPSQITEYLSCPACMKLSRIDRVPRPLSVALPIGGSVHKAVEVQRQRLLNPDVAARMRQGYTPGVMDELSYESDKAIEIAAEHFDASLDVDELDLSGYGSVGEAKDHAVALAKFVLPEVAKLDAARGLVAVELDLRDFPNPWPFKMAGRVDALYGPDPDHCDAGSDLKTSSKQTSPTFGAALQIAIYRTFLPVVWFIDQAAKTRTPSFATYVLSDDGDEFVRELVMDVANRIAAGDFPARPGFLCKYAHPGPSFSVTVDGYNS